MYNLVLTNRDYKREKRAERGGARVGRMGGGEGGQLERERESECLTLTDKDTNSIWRFFYLRGEH